MRVIDNLEKWCISRDPDGSWWVCPPALEGFGWLFSSGAEALAAFADGRVVAEKETTP